MRKYAIRAGTKGKGEDFVWLKSEHIRPGPERKVERACQTVIQADSHDAEIDIETFGVEGEGAEDKEREGVRAGEDWADDAEEEWEGTIK